MIGKAAAGIAALGLIGGVGHVVYDAQGAKVTITDHGKTKSVHIATDGGWYTCPESTTHELEQRMIQLGRVKLTIRQLKRQHSASSWTTPSIARYSALVGEYNTETQAYNAVLDKDCQASESN
jgi:hypothetical protein